MMRLRSGLRVLDRTPRTIQVGADPRWATTLTGLEPSEHALLLRLAHPDRPSVTEALGASTHEAIDRDRLLTITAPLAAAGLLTDTPTAPTMPPSRLLDDAQAADLALLASTQPPERSGAQIVAARAASIVGIVGLGRVGMVVLDTLAHAGVGTFLVDDPREVLPSDLGIGGFTTVDVGRRRGPAAGSVLAREHPDAQVGNTGRDSPDIVVLVFEEVTDTLRTVRLLAEGTTHLAITVREGDIVVGPCVVPGVTACLGCQDLSRTEQDADWPSLREQLKIQGKQAPSVHDSAVTGIAGTLAAAEVLTYLDGRVPTTAGADLEVGTSTAIPRLRNWSVHPRCGCTEMVQR